MQKIKALLYLLIGVVIINSCKKSDGSGSPAEPIYDDNETVTASVNGIVVNDNNIPVQGATVKLGTQTLTTDNYGMFRFQHISISKNNGYINVTRAGYFNGNRSFITKAGSTVNVRIKLLPKTNTGSFVAGAGGTVSLSTGGKVTFPGNAIVDASGNTYTGTVNVAMAWISPLDADLGSMVQGDLRGINAAGNERVLENYGTLGVELTNGLGQVLKIAGGKTAEISMPIPIALQATAPASIALWYFDESIGRWKEEGNATKTGSNYVGNVAHFSFWSCDYSFPRVMLCVNVAAPGNQPLNNVKVLLRRTAHPSSVGCGFTDSLGEVCGGVPLNEVMVLQILDACGNVVYSQNIGPFTANASVNIVATMPATNYLTVTGTVVNCSNQPVTNGTVLFYVGGGYCYYVSTAAAGTFKTTLINCNGAVINFSALPIDNTTLQQGVPVSGSGTNGTMALGNLLACGTSSVQFINITIDGVPYSWTEPKDTVSSNSQPPAVGYSFAVNSLGFHSSAGINSSTTLMYDYNSATGAYPLYLNSIYINLPSLGSSYYSQHITTVNPKINLTKVGTPVSGFIEGNFNLNMSFLPGNVTRNVIGNFKTRRPL